MKTDVLNTGYCVPPRTIERLQKAAERHKGRTGTRPVFECVCWSCDPPALLLKDSVLRHTTLVHAKHAPELEYDVPRSGNGKYVVGAFKEGCNQ
jgi:hypothetical protein